MKTKHTKGEWIKVTDNLPQNKDQAKSEFSMCTLVAIDYKEYLCAHNRGDGSYFITTGHWNNHRFLTSTNCQNITHWMELPPPPSI